MLLFFSQFLIFSFILLEVVLFFIQNPDSILITENEFLNFLFSFFSHFIMLFLLFGLEIDNLSIKHIHIVFQFFVFLLQAFYFLRTGIGFSQFLGSIISNLMMQFSILRLKSLIDFVQPFMILQSFLHGIESQFVLLNL